MREEQELCLKITDVLERGGTRYFLTGSIASMYYGEPRMTRDIDIVVELSYGDVHRIEEAFGPPDYWFDAAVTRKLMQSGGMAMINDIARGMKIDLMCVDDSAYNITRFVRARRVELFPGHFVKMSAPEDVILMKLKFYKEGGSDKHLRDIASMMKISGDEMEKGYLEEWAGKLGVSEELAAVRAKVGW